MGLICRAVSLWHSQANESVFAHYPGLNVVIPSTPEDAAGLLWTAMHCEDPTLVLIPKHLLWAERESQQPIRAVPLGKARKRQAGSDVTVVAWGNTMEKSLEAIEKIGDEIEHRVDRSAFDRALGHGDDRRIGAQNRPVVVVQEDTRIAASDR